MISQARYQVFVSSTYEDLREERQQATQAVLETSCFPSGMELFPASDDTQWELIKRVIEESDYYIVIVAGRYGSLGAEGIKESATRRWNMTTLLKEAYPCLDSLGRTLGKFHLTILSKRRRAGRSLTLSATR